MILIDLDFDIFTNIFSYLNPIDRMTVECVCRTLKYYSDEDNGIWKKYIRLCTEKCNLKIIDRLDDSVCKYSKNMYLEKYHMRYKQIHNILMLLETRKCSMAHEVILKPRKLPCCGPNMVQINDKSASLYDGFEKFICIMEQLIYYMRCQIFRKYHMDVLYNKLIELKQIIPLREYLCIYSCSLFDTLFEYVMRQHESYYIFTQNEQNLLTE